MNTVSNATPDSFEARRFAPAAPAPTRPLYWSVRREIWENRSIYIAPLAVAAVILIGHVIATIHLPAHLRQLSGADPEHYREAMLGPYETAAGFMMGVYILVTLFYCADALHSERRDRSILFWKSLPVSDLTAVLAKVCVPFVVLPLLTFVITLVLQFLMLLVASAVLLANGMSAAPLWTHLPVLEMSLLFLYHIVTAHALWPAPVYCWLLLVSGWARRAALLWAALPVIAIGGVEKLGFHTQHFLSIIVYRLLGMTDAVGFTPPDVFPTDPMTHVTPGQFLLSPSLWIGLLIAGAFLFAAIRLRRYQGPI